ncbi:TPA: hemagglutinin repeat-containing protein [Acinetobacter baumannii]|uniref:hemagglutinin repeat-containing protein n=2 Tax=Acinetobacter baumannii TaxID=470 RepID=UPI0001AEFD55|nr:hemagglutinin repeat-containing protein [Acinetobacter baumannii]EHU1917813.1 hemagglutinin repeat-containing protein [Acinetobacter baumannii]EHU1962999.1 hemagglutinin repeat-containing protein [Acinetobacter baumannii]EKP46163.1 pretoxin HINT domain protein [Acinetobacter baumannii OIFC111]EKU3889782.1 hemagglutinin repeat-containing protein [Acinetobacter baumannii]EKW7784985.1 hemagglutinin repeat-containing protein [Acinetobacter baumannii]
MNKNRYRIIFSHARGMFIAVAEIVKSKTKQAGQSQGMMETDSVTSSVRPIHYKKLNPLNFAVIGCLGALVISLPMSSVAETQIIADKGAPTSQQPTILNSANGTTQVNIQTPSAGGVSRNTYTQFDVGQEGAILNNSRNNTQTQIGGWVQGNPWLATGEAKVILNEVNSSNPSQLKGYIEVAGKQAQVVIANPSGLICDGCGVINADRFTLTTGQAVMNQGYLESFRVREGQVTIEGKGLNGSLTPYTDIYARALKVNAGLYANELGTVLGQNDIQVKDQVTPKITATTGPTSTPQPNFALDVGQLGGMYAGKIFLVGTEQGLGVRNAGSINSTQSTLTLNANGDLVNNGNLIANKDQVQLKAQNIQNTGNISSATSQISVESQNLNNSGLISSADELHLQNQNTITNSGTLNAARIAINSKNLKNRGSIEQTGIQGLDLKSGSMTNLGGKIGIAKSNTGGGTGGSTGGSVPTVPTDPSKDGGSLGVVTPVDTTPKTYYTGFIYVSDVLNNDQGAIVANGGVDLDSQNGLDNQSGQLNLGAINIKGNSFNNNQGQLTVKSANIQTSSFTNQQGQLTSNSTLNIQSQSANNKSGKIQSIGQLDLAVTGELNNVDGQIASGATVNVTASDLKNQSGVVYSENQAVNIKVNKAIDNTEGLIQAKTNLNLDSQSLNNTSGQIVADQINQKHVTVNNNQGSIAAQQNLNSTAQQFDNTQGQIHAKSIKLQHDQLKNTGSVYADQDLTVTGQNIQNAGTLGAGKNVQITSSTLEHSVGGLIAAGLDREGKLGDAGDVSIRSDQVSLHGQTLAGGNLKVQAQSNIDAAKGQLQAQNIELDSVTGNISTQAGSVVAQNQLKLTSQNLINNQQGLLSSQDLILTAKQLDNSQGKIQHTGNNEFTLDFVNGLNNKAGEISSNASSINLNTSALNNETGKIIHAGNQQLNITADQLQGAQGQILSNGQLLLKGGQVVLDGATTSANQINISADSLSHQKGQMVQSGTLNPLTLAIKDQMNNQLGFIQSQSGLQLKTTTLHNQGGQLSSALNYDVQLDVAGLLDNSQSGKIYAGQNGVIQAGSINNSLNGLISAQNALTLTSLGIINNQSGKIVANQDVTLTSNGLDNSSGQIGSSQGIVAINAGSGVVNNTSGTLQAEKNLSVSADQINNQSGLMNSQSSLALISRKDINNKSGQIIAKQDVTTQSQGLANDLGQIGSVQGNVSLDAGLGDLSNQSGKILAAQDLTLSAQNLDNQSGLISAQKHLALKVQKVNNLKGQIQSGDAIEIMGQSLNNQGGSIETNADLTLNINGALDNSQSGKLTGNTTKITAGSINNSNKGQINATDTLTVLSQQAINNQTGVMAANQNVSIQSQGLDNTSGQIGSVQGSLTIDAQKEKLLNTSGSLQAGTSLKITSGGLNNDSGTILALTDNTITSTDDISNKAGKIASNAHTTITTQNLNNQAGMIQSGSGSALDLVINGALDNSQAGHLLSGAGLNLKVNTLDNSQQGQISAQDALNIISAGLINNQAGTLVANQNVTLSSKGLNNNQGQIGSIQGGLAIDAGDQALTNQSGVLQAKTDLTAKALSIDSTEGQIISQAKIDLQSLKEINNQQGIISADQGIQVKSTGLNNNLGQISSAQGEIVLNAGQGLLSNQTGKIIAGQALQLTADQFDNSQQGQLNSQTTLDIQTKKDINNQSGIIAANQKVNLNSQGLNNNQGQIVSLNDALTVNSGSGVLDNQSGTLQAKGDIQLNAEQVNSQSGLISSEAGIDLQVNQLVDNSSGQIIANNAVQIQSQGLKNNQGQIASVNDVLNINSGSGTLENQAGLLQAQGDIQLTADRLLNQSGLINTQGKLSAQINQDIDNSAGQIVANQAVQLNSQGLNNNAGQVGSVAGHVILDAGSGDLSNQSGKIISAQDLTLNAQHVDNQSGLISAQQQLVLNTQGLNNLKGQIISGTNLTFVGQDLNNQGGLLQTNADLDLNLSGVLDNSLAGQLYSGGQTTIKAASVDNSAQGQINSQGDLNITTAQDINNTEGVIVATKQMQLKSQGLENTAGQIGTEQGDILIQTGDLALNNGTGAIQSGKTLTLDVNSLTNSGVISALDQLTLNSQGDVNNDNGQILSNQQLLLTSQNLSNQAGIIQSGEQANLDLTINGVLNNQTGQIHGGANTQIHANSINNSQQGQISAQDALNIISAGLVDNQAGQMIANQNVTLTSQGLNNNQGQIGSIQGSLTVDAGNQALSNQSGTLQAKSDVSVKALSIDNTVGQINTQGNINLLSQQSINNTQGVIVGDQSININSQGLNNNQGQIGTQGDLTVQAGTQVLQNQTGLLQAGQNLNISAAAIDNLLSGQINAQGSAILQSTGLVNNETGTITANQDITLTSQGLNNTQGQIGSVVGSLNLDSGQQILNNQSGSLLSGHQINIHAAGLNNTQGQIVAQQVLDIDAELQALNNQQGLISSDTVNITSGLLNNDQGLIQSNSAMMIDTQGQSLINTNSGTQGGLLSQGNLSLKNVGLLDNKLGYLASGQNLDISANQVQNSGGTLLAAQNLKLQGIGQNQLLNNQSGQILSMGDMQLSVEHINNQGKLASTDADSHIMATGQLDIQTQQLDNQNTLVADTVQGIDAGNLNLNAAIVNNQSGAIRSSQNSQLNISQQLNNQSSEISAVKQLGIQGDQLVMNNLNGQLLAGENLNINAKSLTGDGKVLSLGNADIQLKDSYQHNATAQLQANQNLSLTSAGDINNDGTINAGNQLQLSAVNISNSNNAKIESHDTQLIAQQQINNTGLINGDLTTLTADTVNNQGTGRIYGTDLAISTNTLNNLPDANGTAPVIASRGDMNLGVNVLNNLANTQDYDSQALIFSAGNLYLGGALDENRKATGQATVINNESATIESLGDMRLSTQTINNINKNFSTHEVEVSRQEGLNKYFDGVWANFDGTVFRYMHPGEDSSSYDYDEVITETQVLTSAPAKIIAGGNMDLSGSQVINDKSQIFAGGNLTNTGGTITNTEVLGNRETNVSGWQHLYEKRSGKDFFGDYQFSFSSVETIKLPVSQTIEHYPLNQTNQDITRVSNNTSSNNITSAQTNTTNVNGLKGTDQTTDVGQAGTSQGQNLSVSDSGQTAQGTDAQTTSQNPDISQTTQNNDVTVSTSQVDVADAQKAQGQDLVSAQPNAVQSDIQVSDLNQDTANTQAKNNTTQVSVLEQLQGQTAEQVSEASTTDQANAPDQAGTGEQLEIRTINNSQFKVANNALYRVGADSKAGYLIETDPSFTNYNQWLSSDYMLDALGLDPALQQKRLGDGFYEQRMVQDQIANLTGYRFLEGYGSDEEQYKALMNNGVTYAKQYGLRPGIALTPAQIAQLTSDIVWLVEKDVTLPDGTQTKALAPQVYVKARVGDLKGDGTLLSGNSIKFNLDGDLLNTATIAGREAVQITADNVNNLMGRIQGNTVDITSKKDLNNIGGSIQAKDAMAMNVGGNLNVTSTTRTTDTQVGGFSASTTGLDRVAGLYVGDIQAGAVDLNKATFVLNVAGDSVLKGAEINNSNGATLINTQGNVDIGTVQTGYKLGTVLDARNNSVSQKTQDVGSQINSTGSLLINGQNINIKGSGLNSQATTQLAAVKQLNIEEGRQTSQLDSQWYSKRKGTLSSKTDTGSIHDQANEAIASTIGGKKVILDANNINIRGSQVVSDDLTQIQAKENISITTAENQYSNQFEQTVKKSGFKASLSDGVASVGYGKSSLNTKEDGKSTTLTQSVIRSKTGDTTIIAGKDLTTEAAILDAGKDLNLKGANVNLNAGYTTDEQHSEVHSKQSGISVGVTYSPAMAAAAAYKNSMNNGQFSDSAVGQVMAQGEAARKASMAAMTLVTIQAGSKKTNEVSNTSSTQAVITQATAKGNLNIIATEGSINSQGAQLSAEGDALLHAKENINLNVAQSHSEQTVDRKQSGFSIDNRDWAAPAGTFKNKNQGDGRNTQTTVTQLSVGGKTTLQTGQGDINIVGSSVASKGDVNLHAARDINIKSSQNSQSQSEQSSNKGIGSAQISDTEQFYGYMSGKSQSTSNSVEQQRSQVGSLEGNVNIQAGRQYTQQVADVIAAKDLNIKAQDIQVLEGHNTGSSSENSKDLKVGQFSRVSSPLIDLVNAADKATKSQADDRTQALQAVAAGAQGYQTYSDIKGGALFKAESGIGFSTSKNQQNSSYATSQQNNLKAGGNVNLTSTHGDIHLQNTQVKAEDKINLDSAKNIVLESGQSQNKADGKNSNAGLSVGVGASVGAQTGVYIYGEAGFGKGSNHLDSNTHNQTTLDAKNISLTSKGDTTLRGAQAKADRIDANVGGQLKVESLQDTVEQNTKQTGAGGRLQASFGTAWQASGNFSSSKASGDSNSVNQQSGLFAGNGGYHVKADSVDLKGGAIVSTATKDKNDLTTNRLTFSNIENQSQYDATTVSLSGGTSLGKGKTGDSKASTPTNNDNWRNATSFSPSLPQHESDKDSSTTYATLSEGNIKVGGKSTTVEQLGIHSDASTANRGVETLPNLQTILDKQKTVADATSTIAAATRTYSQNQQQQAEKAKNAEKQNVLNQLGLDSDALKYYESLDSAKQEEYLRQYSPDYAKASDMNQAWGMGGDKSRALNAVTMAVTGALGGQTDVQVVANTLAPYAANMIGEKFGHGEDKNKAAQLASHAILGATLAYLNGGNPAAGGSAAVASEAAADYLANQYKDDPAYKNGKGEFEPNLLPENVKSSIRDLTAAIGAVVGGTVGDSASNVQLAGVIGQNAVENNIDSPAERKASQQIMKKELNASCSAAGLAPGSAACGQYLRNETLTILKKAGSLTADFLPVIGDIKGFVEAETVGDYVFASVGLVPLVGDAAKDFYKAEKAYEAASKVGDVAKMKAAMQDAVHACSGSTCFTAGTLIETDQGLKAVEEFVGGELVWARNDLTLEYGYRPVIATKVTADQPIFHVTVQNEQGQIDVLETTAEHPFWIKDLGWLKASLLQSGMTLLDRDNQEITIVSQALISNKLETVYNIEVEGFHTYHVGELGVWVHNANCCDIKSTNAFVPIKPKLNYTVDIENKAHGYQNIDVSTKQTFDSNGIPKDGKFTKSYLYSSFNENSGELYIQKMAALQPGNATGKEMLSQVIEKIGYSKIKTAKAELAQTNKEAFDNAYKKSGNLIDAVNNTPLGKSMRDLGFKVKSVENTSGMPKVIFERK